MNATSPRINQKDIADRAGVSRATVSLALRNSPLLAEETRRRIQSVARDMGYCPDPLVRTLMTYVRASKPPSFRGTIAYVTNFDEEERWMKQPHFCEWYLGARERCAELGYQLCHFWMGNPVLEQKHCARILRNRGVQGLIFAPLLAPCEFNGFDFTRFASVSIGYTLQSPNLLRVSSNHYKNTLEAMARLWRLGYRRVGMAVPRSVHERVHFAWIAAFHAAKAAGEAPGEIVIYGEGGMWDRDSFSRWLGKNQPDVIVSAGEAVWRWLRELSIGCPSEIGFVDLDRAGTDPYISGVNQDRVRAGKAAAELTIAAIERNAPGVPDETEVLLIDGKWTGGSSLRALK